MLSASWDFRALKNHEFGGLESLSCRRARKSQCKLRLSSLRKLRIWTARKSQMADYITGRDFRALLLFEFIVGLCLLPEALLFTSAQGHNWQARMKGYRTTGIPATFRI